ncbi:FAD-dependent oxidoreductase [Pontibacter sp. JH31]|uniref:FAD-dependent oxidoreductase n=1 Tax=Pontibacter aquaedesilientis TaxID=2766980 RepID=A0ABR7XG71_9BACT|nr:FAD-dependent oxidoreductase [Pontibacter aquaedesilientis]MBD1396401.1 FAD-dependent oxidoreductase [Pontibacter aquaedesilientis]
MSSVTIIGGGIIGLFTAYYLTEAGFEVTILDKGDLKDNCTLGNAGMLVPSHIIPLASPGIIGKGLRWMMSSTSPFYIHPRLDRRLLQWCMLFYKAATPKHVAHSIPYLKNLNLLSKSLYLGIAEQHPEIGLEEKGLLMLYKTAAGELEEKEFVHVARQHGLEAEILSLKEVQALEPNLELDVLGGVLFPGDAHLNPAALSGFLLRHLIDKGVQMKSHVQILDFAASGKKITTVITDQGDFAADHVMVCAGSWSGEVARKLKINLPMLGGKGYSFVADNLPAIQRPTILTEERVAVTPYGDKVRFGGTMEITPANSSINMNRVKGIHAAISRYYTNFDCPFPKQEDVWSGLRPCSPDGLPYIGYTQRWENVLFGTGHSMMGISLAPATGKVLTEQLLNRKESVMTDAFSPDRYR